MKTCLYITYDGLLDPLGQSQILPYIKNLNNKGYEFIIISYEIDDVSFCTRKYLVSNQIFSRVTQCPKSNYIILI